jgi:hypothetical protein
MDYKAICEKAEAYKEKEFFKPEAGTHKVVILSEPLDKVFEDEHGVTKKQVEMEVQVGEKIFTWTVTEGLTKRSLYVQLAMLGLMNEQNLVGVPFTLAVKGEGKKKDYTILEVL